MTQPQPVLAGYARTGQWARYDRPEPAGSGKCGANQGTAAGVAHDAAGHRQWRAGDHTCGGYSVAVVDRALGTGGLRARGGAAPYTERGA
jgi:hypothetical protein